MAWQDWFDFPVIRHVFRHISGTVVTVLLFALAAWVVKAVMPSGPFRNYIEQIEGMVLVGLLILLAIQLAIAIIKEVWQQLRGGWNGTQVLAV